MFSRNIRDDDDEEDDDDFLEAKRRRKERRNRRGSPKPEENRLKDPSVHRGRVRKKDWSDYLDGEEDES